MRHFVYFSAKGVTSGKAISGGDLMKAGRLDIAIHSFIQAVFLSHGLREDVTFHFVLYGMPDPPKHIEITVKKERGIPEEKNQNRVLFSKKDVAKLIQKTPIQGKKGKNGSFTWMFCGEKVLPKSGGRIIRKRH